MTGTQVEATGPRAEGGQEPAGRVLIGIDALPVLTYASAHNGQPVILELTLTPGRGAPLSDLQVRAWLGERGTPLSSVWERHLDTLPAAGISLNPDLAVEPAAMAQVEEQRPADITVEVMSGETLLAREHRAVALLAHNQWLLVRDAAPYSLALLASFVRPNDPALAPVLNAASDLLLARTGDAALQGYQAGPDRVDAIASAIYDSLVAQQINYSDPPASWDVEGLSRRLGVGESLLLGGQKIRTHDDVLSNRLGTCLDTTVLFAACLEAVGVAPLLWLPTGHAFVGYWRDGNLSALRAATTASDLSGEQSDDNPFNLLLTAVDRGYMDVVETTDVTRSADVPSFDQARQHAVIRHIRGEKEWAGVVDVRLCRRSGIVPTPVRHERPDGTVEVVEYHAAKVFLELREPETGGAAHSPGQDVPARVQQWKNTLLDVSLRNQLVNYRPTTTSVRVVVPHRALPWIEDRLHERQSLQLHPVGATDGLERLRGLEIPDEATQQLLLRALEESRTLFTDLPAERYESRLRSLRYKARSIVQESGANSLYLALGSLIWSSGGKEIRSPLILVPVVLSGGTRGTPYRLNLDEAGTSTPNFCLLEKLRQELGLEIPSLAEPASDGAGIDVQGSLDAVRQVIVEQGLSFRVDDTADLAILQYAKFRLWKDLDDHWNRLMVNPLVKHLVEAPTTAFRDPVPDEGPISSTHLDDLAAMCPVPADATQLEAVESAVRGRTFVLEGPPGTGKSQTITNLLARAVAEGKKVLFVAEKRAALDVVKSRLDSVGLDPFCLDLHDKGSKPAAIRRQLLDSLQHQPTRDTAGREVAEGDLRASVTVLSRYRDRLHTPGSLGMSLHDANNLLLALGDGPAIPFPDGLPAQLDHATWAALRRRLTDLPVVIDETHPSRSHPWLLAGDVTAESLDRQALATAVTTAAAALARLDGTVTGRSLAPFVGDSDAAASIRQFLSGSLPPAHVLDQIADPAWSSAIATSVNALKSLERSFPSLQWCQPSILGLPLTQVSAAAQSAATAGVFSRRKRQEAVLAQLAPCLRPGPQPPLDGLASLAAELQQAQQFAGQHLYALQSRAGLESIGPINPLVPGELNAVEQRVAWLRWGAQVASSAPASPLRTALRALADDPGTGASTLSDLQQLADAWSTIQRLLHTEQGSLQAWAAGDTIEQALRRCLPQWAADSGNARFPLLVKWLGLSAELAALRAAGLTQVVDSILDRTADPTELAQAASRGVTAAVLDERLTAQGLDAFDPAAHERTIKRFARSSADLRSQMTDVIPADLVEGRSFHSGSAAGEVGALQRELTKQRRGLGIRALLSRYWRIVGDLTPCLLVSPDSIARFLDPEKIHFDLVVFDEASQIRVADAIGAMGRANSVVVVGDSKQMPPNEFGLSGSDDEDEEPDEVTELLVADEESILTECVQARLPRLWLSWHYRSQDEALIAFSNSQYYEGRLSSFPAPTSQATEPAVSLHRVDGQFHRTGPRTQLRTNPIEAAAVVADVQARLAADPLASIGIVTFNVQQRDLILSLLAASQDENVAAALEREDDRSLFVKNLESVQGDERDVILFSIGFAKNDKGVLPLNFGPLNRLGGERRLNVAVTRARRQVVVFCSFDPSDLRAESTASIGIAHLRSYLELAARGPEAVVGRVSPPGRGPERHRDAVAGALRARGWDVRTDVGLSDFRVDLAVTSRLTPGLDLCAVLLDGLGWAGRGTVGDRDGLPITVLGGMLHWPHVARIWLPAWLQDREAVLDSLEEDLLEVDRRLHASQSDAPDGAPPEPEGMGDPLDPVGTGGFSAQVLVTPPATPSPAAVEPTTPLAGAEASAASGPPSAPAGSSPMDVPLGLDARLTETTTQTPEFEVLTTPAEKYLDGSTGSVDPAITGPTSSTTSAVGDETGTTAAPAGTSGEPVAVPFIAWAPGRLGGRDILDELGSRSAAAAVREALLAGIAAEGPIHRDRLCRAVGNAFGFDRVRQERIDAMVHLIPRAVTRTHEGSFLWPDHLDPTNWRGYRTSTAASARPLDHIAPEEVTNAMQALLRAAGGMEREELYRETLAVFGMKRLTDGIRSTLDTVSRSAVRRRRLLHDSGLLRDGEP